MPTVRRRRRSRYKPAVPCARRMRSAVLRAVCDRNLLRRSSVGTGVRSQSAGVRLHGSARRGVQRTRLPTVHSAAERGRVADKAMTDHMQSGLGAYAACPPEGPIDWQVGAGRVIELPKADMFLVLASADGGETFDVVAASPGSSTAVGAHVRIQPAFTAGPAPVHRAYAATGCMDLTCANPEHYAGNGSLRTYDGNRVSVVSASPYTDVLRRGIEEDMRRDAEKRVQALEDLVANGVHKTMTGAQCSNKQELGANAVCRGCGWVGARNVPPDNRESTVPHYGA